MSSDGAASATPGSARRVIIVKGVCVVRIVRGYRFRHWGLRKLLHVHICTRKHHVCRDAAASRVLDKM